MKKQVAGSKLSGGMVSDEKLAPSLDNGSENQVAGSELSDGMVSDEELAPSLDNGSENATDVESEEVAPSNQDNGLAEEVSALKKRNDGLEKKLELVLDSVAKLIESGVQIGGNIPTRRNSPERTESEKALDHLIKE